MSIFMGGASGGGFDWGGFAGQAANVIGGIYATKAQTKMLKQLNKLRMGGMPMTGGGYQLAALGGGGVPAAMGFAPALPAVGGPALGAGAAGLLASLGLTLPSVGGITDILPGGLEEIGSGTGLFGLDMFEPTKAGSRARKVLRATNPSTGNDTYWRHVGAPLLFRGDLGVCKLVNKVAARAARGRGRASTGRFRKRRC